MRGSRQPPAAVAAGLGTGPDPAAAVAAALSEVSQALAPAAPTACSSAVSVENAGHKQTADGDGIDLAVVFVGAAYAPAAEQIAVAVDRRLMPRHSVGMTVEGVVAGAREVERPDSVSLWAARLPGATLTSLRYDPPSDGGQVRGWRPPPDDADGLVLVADPFTFPGEAFLAWLRQARPGLPVSGGLASGGRGAGQNRLLLDGDTLRDGAVGVALGGVGVTALVSQGCRPVGRSWVVTAAQRNLVQQLAGEATVERIRETFAEAPDADRQRMRSGLHIGMVIDEYREAFGRGDFLVRNVLGADPESGAVAVGDLVEVGQTVQFHVRDAASADEDLRELLATLQGGADAALLFTCNGRGSRLFGAPDHDAALVHGALGGVPLAGAFCAGEFGPVGNRSFLHGFTASLLVLDSRQPA